MVAKTRRLAAANSVPNGIDIDLSKITARQMGDFFTAAHENDMESLAEFFVVVVTACPFGDPTDVDTYLGLPFFGEFQDVLNAVVDASKKTQQR